jgi:hypothetical protein
MGGSYLVLPRTPARFSQSEIARTIRAIKQSGGNMVVEILVEGTIRIVPLAPSDMDQTSPFDETLGITL